MASTQIKVGNYTLLETLGVGSFGKVKLAVHAHTGHKVALKIINRRRIANMDMVGRVKREIQYLKLLRHPHIIKLYEVITTPTDIIMVMEYAGGELFNYIVNRGRMSEDDARRFFQQIVCAVEYCHRHKIVHRDLKPENVLLDEYDQVKIADFGLSNIMSDGDFLKTSCGSPNYAAPEVINGKLYAGPEVDVWSCGVILYVMLCGRLPFDDDYIPALFKKINGGIFTIPSFLSPAVRSLLQSMLIVDPLKRITISQICETEWFKKGLPDYLQPLPEKLTSFPQEVDETVVSDIATKMGHSVETVRKALKETENNQIKVAYELVLDHRRILAGVKHSHPKTLHHYLLSESPPAWNAPIRTRPPPSALSRAINSDQAATSNHLSSTHLLSASPTLSSSIAVLPSSLPKPAALPPVPATTTPGKRPKARSRWHFGIRSHSAPADIMQEIYKAIRNAGMTWRVIEPWSVRCRYEIPSATGSVDTAGEAGTVTNPPIVGKLDIRLYGVEGGSWVVDFKDASGLVKLPMTSSEAKGGGQEEEACIGVFAFFEACGRLITELAISA
ncbi:Protein kinase [Gaertneriomyces sp. JEL0708]|nr:Protein kinase [Gaertneriomyces sp. JEL0708]